MGKEHLTLGIIGNPNCGKTTLFNGLTGSHQHVGNWPGVTVERKEGSFTLPSGKAVKVVDTPGIYSLTASSEDERATLSYLLSHDAELYVNVIDATAIERNLYLTLLLCELKVPMVVVVTMMDVARQRHIEIDLSHLSHHLGVPVVGVNATDRRDVAQLLETLDQALELARVPTVKIAYPNELEQEIDTLASACVKTSRAYGVEPRWVAIKALEGDPMVTEALNRHHDMAPEVTGGAIARCTDVLREPPDVALADARYGVIAGLVRDVVHLTESRITVSEWIDRFALNQFLGIPFFLAVMFVVFWLTQVVAGDFIDLFDTWGGAVFVDGSASLLHALKAPDWLMALVSKGLGSALQTVFSFIPPIFFMFLCLATLEDSGYMARAAFVMDRFMRWIGLPGKSFVPMLVGFGCSVPAIMATRTLESKRDRLLTVFMVPFMSCSAKLPVWTLFAAAFAANAPGKMVFLMYITGIVLGVVTGLALKYTLFQGEPTHFIMELPPYHCPRPKHILLHTWERLKIFIWRAGKFIAPMILVLGLLNTVGTDGSIGNENSEKSILSKVGRAVTPAFESIGVEKDNWQASVAVFSGLFAKESVISTMRGLYGQSEDDEAGTLRALQTHFRKGFHQVFSFLLFILLYVPCVGATGVVFREIGKVYGTIFVGYLTLLGWSVATIYHAVMVTHSVAWLETGVLTLAAMFTAFWLYGRHHRSNML